MLRELYSLFLVVGGGVCLGAAAVALTSQPWDLWIRCLGWGLAYIGWQMLHWDGRLTERHEVQKKKESQPHVPDTGHIHSDERCQVPG